MPQVAKQGDLISSAGSEDAQAEGSLSWATQSHAGHLG